MFQIDILTITFHLLSQLSFNYNFVLQQRDENFVQNIEMHQQKNLPAIYTHCYDTSGTRLFAAGGPLQCQLKGNYVALFQ